MDQEFRTTATTAYLKYVMQTVGRVIKAVASPEELIALARTLDGAEVETEHGWRSDPPFPGVHEQPEAMELGSYRMICASRIYKDDVEKGVLFMTFRSEKGPNIFIAGPTTVIPPEFKRVHS
jgi:hypothetical protein